MPYNTLISKIRCSTPNKVGSRKRNQNYLMYIATREGVDLSPLEDEMADNEKYLKYIHERPKSHGLFGNLPSDQIRDISQLSSDIYQLSKQTPVYRAIISLDERDAAMFDYTTKDAWQTYLRRAMPDLGNAFGMPIQSLQWVGAVHMEQNHPHVHCMFWRTDGRIQNPFIHKSKQHECRELLSGIMFRNEREKIVIQRAVERDTVLSLSKNIIQEEMDLLKKITPGIQDPIKIPQKISSEKLDAVTIELVKLFEMLPKHGRLTYGFVSSETKAQVNKITQLLMQHKDIKSSADLYSSYTDIISQTYSASEKHSNVTLDKAFEDLNTRMGNIVLSSTKELIREYNTLGNSIDQLISTYKESFSANNLPLTETLYSNNLGSSTTDLTLLDIPDYLTESTANNNALNSMHSLPIDDNHLDNDLGLTGLDFSDKQDYLTNAINDATGSSEIQPLHSDEYSGHNAHIEWTKNYKNASGFLYCQNPQPEKALSLMSHEANNGNVLAIYDYAKYLENGIGTDTDQKSATVYYEKALETFKHLFDYPNADEEKMRGYIAYRIGKMYHYGKGCSVDLESAKAWYKQASSNKYAQYSLAKIYLTELSTNPALPQKDDIIPLLQRSSESQNAFATFELAKLYEKGYLTPPNEKLSYQYYQNTIEEFEKILAKNPDGNNENLAYILGKLYENGKGCVTDLTKALFYYDLASRTNNTLALYSIAKINVFLENYEVAEDILNRLLSQKDLTDSMHYNIGKLYADKESELYDLTKAISYLEASADQGNQFAQYALGKIYADSESELYDLAKAISYLEASADQGNQFAQYTLGKIYANSELELYDLAKASSYLDASADQGNQFAQYALGKIYADSESELYDLAKAISYLDASAGQGNQFAQYALGKTYADSKSELCDLVKAISYLDASADQENQFAQYALGKIYADSESELYNLAKAISYLEASTDQGNQFAQYTLGKIYADSESELYDLAKAISYLEASADQGNQFAQYTLGKIYADSESELYDLAKAISYLEASADQGNQFAQYTLGKIYADSESELFDLAKAISYLEASADQGNQFAQYALGKIYADSESGFFDISKAILYLEKSALQENSFAQLKLACIYLYGKGVPSDRELGMLWLAKAIEQGNDIANTVLKSYLAFEAESIYSYAFKLFSNVYQGLAADNQKKATAQSDIFFRTLSRKALREEALKNPEKHEK